MDRRLLALIRLARETQSGADLLASAAGDRAALAELVARHGPMVWNVCRHMLGDADAEDAFQATFLALIRFASRIRKQAALGSWLYGVAVRVSLSARREAGRRRNRERVAAASEAISPSEPDDRAERMAAVHQEVAALPEVDRSAFVLCVMEGLTQAEAATRLGQTPGAIAGQVARAKKRLAARLTERGIVPALAALGTASITGAVPPGLVERVVNLTGAEAPPAVLRLVKGATGMSLSSKMLLAAAAAVCAILAVAGVQLGAADVPPDPPAATKEEKPVAVAAEKKAEGGRTWKGRIRERGTDKPIAGAEVVIAITADEVPAKKLAKIDRKVIQKTDADGKYEFPVTAEEAARGGLYIELTISSKEHTQYFGGYGYSLILKNETLGQRPFFENLVLWPGKPVEGVVKTPEGKPAAGVKVLAYTTPFAGKTGSNSRFPETKTDDQGRFRLMVYAEGLSVFWILPQDYAPEAHGVPKEKRGDFGEFTLAKGERLAGKLLDSGGKPVAGVYVEVGVVRKKEDKPDPDKEKFVMPGAVVNQIHRAAVTAADGSFEFRPLPAGFYRITPTERGWDPSTRVNNKEPERRPLPAVFLPRQVILKKGEPLPPVVIRAVPHVVVEAQWYNSKGKKGGGADLTLFGSLGKRFWNITSSPDANGKFRLMVPKGLESARISIIYDPDSALQFRLKKDAPLQFTRDFDLGTLDADMNELEIIRYAAPTIVISVVDKNGKAIENFAPSVV
ncbi:MAG TPA: sigma-70 family RNA polymerase sigma factor, partial [Urbifossiella sp.]